MDTKFEARSIQHSQERFDRWITIRREYAIETFAGNTSSLCYCRHTLRFSDMAQCRK